MSADNDEEVPPLRLAALGFGRDDDLFNPSAPPLAEAARRA